MVNNIKINYQIGNYNIDLRSIKSIKKSHKKLRKKAYT